MPPAQFSHSSSLRTPALTHAAQPALAVLILLAGSAGWGCCPSTYLVNFRPTEATINDNQKFPIYMVLGRSVAESREIEAIPPKDWFANEFSDNPEEVAARDRVKALIQKMGTVMIPLDMEGSGTVNANGKPIGKGLKLIVDSAPKPGSVVPQLAEKGEIAFFVPHKMDAIFLFAHFKGQTQSRKLIWYQYFCHRLYTFSDPMQRLTINVAAKNFGDITRISDDEVPQTAGGTGR